MKIILTLEQFPIFWPGAFGNKMIPTPGLDAFTLKSTVFDRVYSTCADGLETLFQLWEAFNFSAPDFAGRKVFLSDLPVEAPDFFEEGKTLSAETFFTQSSLNSHLSNESETGLVWIHFQNWTLEALDSWLKTEENQNKILAILGTSGELPTGDVRLYSSEVQLPWWIRFQNPVFEGTRSHALVTADDFRTILEMENPNAVYRDGIRIHTENDRWAVVTDEWFLTGFETPSFSEDEKPGNEDLEADAPELYFKPSDWWDQNDVADRCFDEVQELLRFRDSE